MCRARLLNFTRALGAARYTGVRMIERSLFPRFATLVLIIAGQAMLPAPAHGATKKRKPEQPAPQAPTEPLKTSPTEDVGRSRTSLHDVRQEEAANGAHSFWFGRWDDFTGKDSPDIRACALDIEAQFSFDTRLDGNGVLVSHGGPQLGWAIHFIDGKPAITINYEGLHTTLCAEEPMTEGTVTLRALLGLDGTLAISATGLTKPVHGYAPMTGGFTRQPDQGLQVTGGGALPSAEVFPNKTVYGSDVRFVRLTLLPALPPPPAAPAPPAKTKARARGK